MAKVMGFQMKSVKTTIGHEGYGCLATMYLDGKKIGSYTDYGDGGGEMVDYINKDAEEKMMRRIIDYAKVTPNDFIVDLYKQRPQQYKEECERFKKYHPYIPDEDINMQTMASNSICYIASRFLELYEFEQSFKKAMKKGYKCIGVKGDKIYSYPVSWSEEKIKADGCDSIYKCLEDFDVQI